MTPDASITYGRKIVGLMWYSSLVCLEGKELNPLKILVATVLMLAFAATGSAFAQALMLDRDFNNAIIDVGTLNPGFPDPDRFTIPELRRDACGMNERCRDPRLDDDLGYPKMKIDIDVIDCGMQIHCGRTKADEIKSVQDHMRQLLNCHADYSCIEALTNPPQQALDDDPRVGIDCPPNAECANTISAVETKGETLTEDEIRQKHTGGGVEPLPSRVSTGRPEPATPPTPPPAPSLKPPPTSTPSQTPTPLPVTKP